MTTDSGLGRSEIASIGPNQVNLEGNGSSNNYEVFRRIIMRKFSTHYAYLNADESFVIEVGNNHLAGYHYKPGSKQKDLRCEPTERD